MNMQQAMYAFTLALIIHCASSRTIDEVIRSSAQDSHVMDFLQTDRSVTVEMDMKFTPEQWDEIERLNRTGKVQRNSVRSTNRRWTNRQVPYSISKYFSQHDVDQVNAAIKDWKRYTCLNFHPYTAKEKNRIFFQNGKGCSSYVGMIGGRQPVSLATGCRMKGIILHEIGHALGFHHEQTRPDRNEYVTILRQNINPRALFNFRLYTSAVINTYKVPYDYYSIMHYGAYAFTMNKKPTILTKDRGMVNVIGNRYGLSFRDIKLVNLMYQCNAQCKSRPACPGEGFVGKDCKCWCPGHPVKYCRKQDGGHKFGRECVDKHVYCSTWAKQNFCNHSRLRTFMSFYCRKSCNLCTGGSTALDICRDNNVSCRRWARKGECSRHSRYMLVHCKKSCDKC